MQPREQQEGPKPHIQRKKQHEGNIKYELASNCIGDINNIYACTYKHIKCNKHVANV
jgi:hypothetical protein